MRTVEWIGSSLDDLRGFPHDVQGEMGYALYLAQLGEKHRNAKPLGGFAGASVLEIIDDYDSDTYRCIYTVRLKTAIYVLHAFQKKAKRGIATARADIDLVKSRLKAAQELDAQREADLESLTNPSSGEER